jgi:hypothetical protein
MAKSAVGKQSAAQASTGERAARSDSATGQHDAASLEQAVQRLACAGPGAGDVGEAALAVQRIAGNRSAARMLNARAGRPGRRPGELARAGFQGGGGQLPFMARIQASFGSHDIRGVRSFTGPSATAASRALSARAYASGDNVVFAEAAPDLRTAAHEAAHVVQQRAGVDLPGGLGEVGDRHERHADAVADMVVRGESVQRSLDAYFTARPGAASPRGGDAGVQRVLADDLKDDVDDTKKDVKDTKARYAKILTKLADAVEARNKFIEEKNADKSADEKQPLLSINPDAVIEYMIYRLENFSGDVVYRDYNHLIEALKSRGAILLDGKESGAIPAKSTDKIQLTLLLPGSGDRRWRTQAENMIGDSVATRKDAFKKTVEIKGDDTAKRKALGIKSGKYKYPTVYEETSNLARGATYTIRGPGTTNVTSSHPSNSIAANVETAAAIVDSFLAEQWDPAKVKLQIMGHSRNGVAAARLTSKLKTKYPALEIASVIFDPVPGGDANMFNHYNEESLAEDSSEASDESSDKESEQLSKDADNTVIYSLMDIRAGFNPMRVYGARRLILTQYTHHAGIEPGFMYEDVHYKGLGLLSLPPGLFIDFKQSAGKPNLLKGPITDWDDINIVLTAALTVQDKKNKNRIARIRKVIEAFLGKASPEKGGDLETGVE